MLQMKDNLDITVNKIKKKTLFNSTRKTISFFNFLAHKNSLVGLFSTMSIVVLKFDLVTLSGL